MFTPGFYERCQPLPATLTQAHADPLNIDALQEFVHLGGTHRNTGSRCPGPPGGIGEGAGLQALQAEPEATVLPHQHLQPPTVTADEDETVSRIRIAAELTRDRIPGCRYLDACPGGHGPRRPVSTWRSSAWRFLREQIFQDGPDNLGVSSALYQEAMAPRKVHRHGGIATATTLTQGTDDQFNETKGWGRGHPVQDGRNNLAKP